MKKLFIIEKVQDQSYWHQVGMAFPENKDGSINIRLWMFPHLRFQLREAKEPEPEKAPE